MNSRRISFVQNGDANLPSDDGHESIPLSIRLIAFRFIYRSLLRLSKLFRTDASVAN